VEEEEEFDEDSDDGNFFNAMNNVNVEGERATSTHLTHSALYGHRPVEWLLP